MRKSRSLSIFYLLVGYVLIQLLWWGFHIIQLTQQLDASDGVVARRFWMIFGEGSVFFLIFILGVVQIRKSFRKEEKLLAKERNFMLSVTHELKTPIASSMLALQTLQQRELTPEKRQEVLARMLQDQQRLDALVQNILIASALSDGQQTKVKESTNVLEVLHALESRMGISGDCTIEIDSSISAPISTDELDLILSNLISNSIKYSEGPPKITLSAKQDKKGTSIVVADEGIGIPEEDRSRVFEKFSRLGEELTRKTKGTGLGLYIVAELLRKNDGTIKIESNKPVGSRFSIYLKGE